MATNVPPVTFGPTGFQAPGAPAVFAGVCADITAAFGKTLNYSVTTPQGQLASSETALIVDTNSIFVYYTNQVDPAYATGRMQDAIARIYFIERDPAEPTVLQVACLGLENVQIPLSATVADAAGNVYRCTAPGTIPVGGTITLPFAAVNPGPLAIPETVRIYQAVPGWDQAAVISGVVGQNTESRSQFEARRRASVAHNSVSMVQSVRGAVLLVPGVLDAYVTENVESSPVAVGGYNLAANSIYVAAVGGDAQDIAEAIWSKKSPGCAYNGNTTVVVVDSDGYSPPYPEYQVSFEIPDPLPILYAVQIADGPEVPSDAVQQIRAAISAAFSGEDGGARARIGAKIYASRYVTPVAALGAWAQIVSLLIGSDNAPAASFTASMAGTVMTVTFVGSGTLAVGQTVLDAARAVAPATKILAQLTGPAGGIGTYTINVPQTVASRAMTGSVASGTVTVVDIDQSPTLDDDNISVEIV